MAANIVQTQVMLKIDDVQLASRVRRAVASGLLEIVNEDDDVQVSPETFVSRRMRFRLGSEDYPARLVNLPTIVETHKAIRKTYYKCGDVSQLVIVYKTEAQRRDDEARIPKEKAWRTVYPDGLAAPNKDAVTRKFARARRQKSRVDASPREVSSVEALMLDVARNQFDDPEQLTEDIVPFEDWMVTVDNPRGATFGDDNPLAARHPWIFVPNPSQHTEFKGQPPVAVDDEPPPPPPPQEDPVVPDTPAARAANQRRLAFVARRDAVARDLKTTQLRIQQIAPADKMSDHESSSPDLDDLQATCRRLLLELNQLDEKLLNCEIEAHTLQSSSNAAATLPPGD